MKLVDYLCNECNNVIKDFIVYDGEDIPSEIKCPNCGSKAIRLLSFNKVIPKKHRAV
jgi:DNA-directed RNA polymerase subunit RPC12/RpoP